MGRDSRATRKVRRAGHGRRTSVLRVREPADIAVALPYLLGFEPHDSLVLAGLQGTSSRVGPTMRTDLVPPSESAGLVDYLAGTVRQLGVSQVLVAAFTDDAMRAGSVVHPLLEILSAKGVGVREAIRADGVRWWSYLCVGDCCRADGTPYDARTSRVAAEAVAAGLAKETSRAALAGQFAPEPERQSRVAAAIGAGVTTCAAEIDALLAVGLRDPHALDDAAVGGLLVHVQESGQRDRIWMSIDRGCAQRQLALWAAITRAAPEPLLPPSGSLAAFAAWLAGYGAVASAAVERVLAVDPTYSMARLVDEALVRVLDPRAWTAPHRGELGPFDRGAGG